MAKIRTPFGTVDIKGQGGEPGPRGPAGPQGPTGPTYISGIYRSKSTYSSDQCLDYSTRNGSVQWKDEHIEGGTSNWVADQIILLIIEATNGDTYLSFQKVETNLQSLRPQKIYWISYRGNQGESGPAGKDGTNGYTFTPTVNLSGNLSWTKQQGSGGATPSSVNIKGPKGDTGDKGEPGTNGKDGISCTHSWNGTTLTVTSASGTSSQNLKGETGPQGPEGPRGQTGPQGDANYSMNYANGILNITIK